MNKQIKLDIPEKARFEKFWIENEIKDLEIKEANINDLYLYPENTRLTIHAQQRGLDLSNFQDEKTQKELRDIIETVYQKQNAETIESLKTHGLKEAIFITKEGIVLSGNRRLTLMKKIYEEDIKNGVESSFAKIPVVVEERELTDLEKKSYELMLQYDPETKVPYTRLSKMDSAAKSYDLFKAKKLNDSEIAKKLGYKRKDTMIKDIEEYYILLEYINFYNSDVNEESDKKNIWDFDGEKILNVIDTINRLTSKDGQDEQEKEKIKKSIFSLMVLDTSQSLDIRSVFNNAYSEKGQNEFFVKQIDDLISKKLSTENLKLIKNKLISEEEINDERKIIRTKVSAMAKVASSTKTDSSRIMLLENLTGDINSITSQLKTSVLSDNKKKTIKRINKEIKKISKVLEKISN